MNKNMIALIPKIRFSSNNAGFNSKFVISVIRVCRHLSSRLNNTFNKTQHILIKLCSISTS